MIFLLGTFFAYRNACGQGCFLLLYTITRGDTTTKKAFTCRQKRFLSFVKVVSKTKDVFITHNKDI